MSREDEASSECEANLLEDHRLVSGRTKAVSSISGFVDMQHCGVLSIVGMRDETSTSSRVDAFTFRLEQDDVLSSSDYL